MGSSLFPNYTLEKKPYLELKFWKIFKGTSKTKGDNISAFIFEKKVLDKRSEKERENILLCLRKEPETLIRGKNKHKNFLTIIEPIKEDNSSMGFITEYISFNLISWIKDYHPSKLEIKYIIYQILSVVLFIHSEYHISHNNLNPENIFITEKNFIKITGFMFNTSLIKDTNNNNNNNLIFSKNIVELFCNLNYASPDLILNNEINNNSDIFIIGLISYYLLDEKNNYNDLFVLNDNSYDSYKNTYKNINLDKKINNFTKDDYVKEFLKSLLNNNPEKRKNLTQMQNSKFFVESEDNNKLVPLCLLSKMESTEISSNYDLLKLLPNILNLYTTKEKEFLILPNLLYHLKIENLINPIVPALFLISEQNKKDINFEEKIWPSFKKLFNMKKFPAATLYFTLKKMNFIINNLEKSEFNKYCIPLIGKALDCGVQKIQEVVLDELPNLLKNLDKNEFQNNIYNRLVKIVIQTNNKKLRKKIMNSFISLTEYFDSYFINNNFLDDIEKIIKSETTLNICKNAFILYEKIKLKVNDKSVRSKIIPSLLLMMCNGEISEDLFNQGENIIHSYIQKIKEKRKDQFVQEIESDSEEKNNAKNNNEDNNSNNNDKNSKNNNSIGINSPLSVSRTKSTLSGNISLLECNSSEDSGFGVDEKNKMKKEKIVKIQKDKIQKKSNINSNNNNNIFDNLLNDNNEEEYNKNNDSSFDSTSVGKNKNKTDFDFVSKKEFLSSLELKKVESKKKLENKETSKKKSKFNENKKNRWEEIESDDEITDELERYIKPRKNKEEKKDNNLIKKESIISDKKKKWDEDDDEDENDDNSIKQNNENKIQIIKEDKNNDENKLNELLLLDDKVENETRKESNNSSPLKLDNNRIIKGENKEEKIELDDEKDKNSSKKKGIKKKKKHKKKEQSEKKIDKEETKEIINDNKKEGKEEEKNKQKIDEGNGINNKIKEREEKSIERQISTTKMRMEKRAATLDLDNLLADDD